MQDYFGDTLTVGDSVIVPRITMIKEKPMVGKVEFLSPISDFLDVSFEELGYFVFHKKEVVKKYK